jgi:hypothetical protein
VLDAHKQRILDYCEKYDGTRINGTKRGTPEYKVKKLGMEYCKKLYNHSEAVSAVRILEVGFGWGFSAMSFLLSLSNRKGGHLISVDPKPQVTTVQIYKAAKELGVDYEFVQEKSRFYQPSGRYDLVYIDGDPFQSLMDYERFEPFVRSGGRIVMDGYAGQEGIGGGCPKMAANSIGEFISERYGKIAAFAVFTHK